MHTTVPEPEIDSVGEITENPETVLLKDSQAGDVVREDVGSDSMCVHVRDGPFFDDSPHRGGHDPLAMVTWSEVVYQDRAIHR